MFNYPIRMIEQILSCRLDKMLRIKGKNRDSQKEMRMRGFEERNCKEGEEFWWKHGS
ncbi:hypothetical protein J11TS1_24710 [Oceanobacillus sp. J11TS1]|nr:hypothetical protein J11TS1_24710 [Oceanobacillus sp. J11TS1]